MEHSGNILYIHMTQAIAEHDRCQSHFEQLPVSHAVTHPSIDQAHDCLTSVIGPWMVAPCLRGSSCKHVNYVMTS